jgi:superoxide dismutase, Cu-Zn family
LAFLSFQCRSKFCIAPPPAGGLKTDLTFEPAGINLALILDYGIGGKIMTLSQRLLRDPRRTPFTRFALTLAACAAVSGCDRDPGPTENPTSPPPGSPPTPSATIAPATPVPSAATATDRAAAVAPGTRARAVLEPTAGSSVRGSVEFVTGGHGGLTIEATLAGLTPGRHGLHIHEIGDCSAPDASSAGDHFAPRGQRHGAPSDPPAERHAGDLGNITANDAGIAATTMADPQLQLSGEFGIVGRALIVHADADDLQSQPSGESGDPVACGVIELAEAAR